MASPNAVNKESRASHAHLNWMGGSSWDLSNPITTLRMAAASSFFGEPMYYHNEPGLKLAAKDPREPTYRDARLSASQLRYLRSTLSARDPQDWREMSPSALMVSAIDKALAHDPEATLALAAELRNEWNIRTTPQVIMVRAANTKALKGTGLVRKYADKIIIRADELSVQLAYQLAAYGRPIPNALKKAWRDAFARFDAYQLGKYKMESRVVKTRDVANLVHPVGSAVAALMEGTLPVPETWETYISANGASKETWTTIIPKMGHMALLRNIVNFTKHEVDPKLWVDQLIAGVEGGRQLPFRYYSAFKAAQAAGASGLVLDAIEKCLELSFQYSPHFVGRTMSLCDNSGSAWGSTTSSLGTMHMAEIANLSAVMTARCSDEGHIGVFGDRLDTWEIRKKTSVFDELTKATKHSRGIGGGTEHGIWLFWDRAIRNSEHWDNVFVYSDMQAGHGGLYGRDDSYKNFLWPDTRSHIDVPKLITEYRKKVNPNVNVYLVQVAGYQDTIVPEFYDRTYILGGWGEGLLRFAHAMSYGIPQQ